MKDDTKPVAEEQHRKPRRAKSREVSSRFLSLSATPSIDNNGTASPKHDHSPVRRKSTSTDIRKPRSLEDSGFVRGLWPSSNAPSSVSKTHGTLADHLGNERLKELLEQKTHEKSANTSVFSLSRQRSCSEFNRFENEKATPQENNGIFGGSMRYKEKSGSQRKSSSSSLPNSSIFPGRLSVDENVLYKSSQRRSNPFADNLDSESDYSDLNSNMGYNSPAMTRNLSKSSKKSGTEVSSKYLHDIPKRIRSGTSDSNIPNPVSADYSPKSKKFTMKNAMKRANSLTGYGSAMSQWALSPGRTGSPPMTVENKAKPISFSTLRPPSSPSKVKGVEKLLNLGLDLFKTKKSSSSPMGSGDVDNFHQLRLLHNRLMQWFYVNARADMVNESINNQSQNNLFCAWDSLTKLRNSVLHKKLQLQKEKLEMKLSFILQSQIKQLEVWAALDKQHSSAISSTSECLHSVVCRVPLIEGAKVEPESASIAIRHALDLTAAIESDLTTFSMPAEQTVYLLSELAEVIAQEKLLLDECIELFKAISILEIQERSLRCNHVQLSLMQTQLQHQQNQEQQKRLE